MLESTKIIVSAKNAKPEKFDAIRNFVFFSIRNYEYEKLTTSDEYKRLKALIEDDHEGINALTCPEDTVSEYLKDTTDRQLWLDLRKEALSLKDELSKLPTLDKYNALTDTDKVFIKLQAHTAITAIKLDESVLKDMDFTQAVNTFYSKGSMTKIKDILKAIFTNCVGSEGELFYAVKLRKSDFGAEDIRSCLAAFRGTAKRPVDKEKKLGRYDWVKKDGNTKQQAMAVTNLFAVVLDRDNEYEVVKPEETTAE